MSVKVSIIMPAYNVEKYIVEAVESILNQTEKNWELLICDDGSSDKTWEIIQSFKDPRIKKFKNNKNIGNLKTTNFLFEQCKGEFIAIQDADDYCALNKLELQLKTFEKDQELELIGVNYELMDVNKKGIRCGFYPLVDEEIKKVCLTECPPFVYAGIMIKKHVLSKVGNFRSFFDRIGGGDYDWMYRIVEQCKVKNIREVLYFYRLNPNSFTNSPNANFLKLHSEDIALFLVQQRYKDNGKDALTRNKSKEINQFLSTRFIEISTKHFWNKKQDFALRYAKWALFQKPFSINTLKHYFYVLRKSI